MEKRDIHQTVTDQIITAIEAGAGQWRMPWVGKTNGLPFNATTGKAYRGVNIVSLWIEGMGYPTQEWASYQQWSEEGAQVRKGEKGSMIVFYKSYTKEKHNTDTGQTTEESAMVLKYSHVFNAAQVDGWNSPTIELPNLAQRIEAAERFVTSTNATIQYGGLRAFYAPSRDLICMPDFAAFIATETATATENAYGTLLHELTHWTSHKTRCDRELAKRFGSDAYAAEELIAELGAAFLCAELGISPAPRQDHAQYLQSWLNVLKGDKRAIFTAASKASAACDYLNQLQQSQALAA
jgi:antirestriction protein ArdC